MKNDILFIDFIKNLSNEWKSYPEKYSGTSVGVADYSMSGRDLLEKYYRTADEILIESDNHLITNSINNRPESKSGELFIIRNRYTYCMIAGVSDSNFFPISMIDNSDNPDESINHLMLKDRGNLTSVLKRASEKILTVNEWAKLINGIEENPFNEFKLKNKRFKKIVEKSKKLLEKHIKPKDRRSTKYSLKEMLGADVWNEWYEHPYSVNCRIKFETVGSHTNEMQAYNNTETRWIQYNYLTSEINLKSIYDEDEVSKDALDKIHLECIDEPVFLGQMDLLGNVDYKKHEGFESWFPIDFTACTLLTWKDMISEMARKSKYATKAKRKQWMKLFSAKDNKNIFTVYNKVLDNIKLIKKISTLVNVEAYTAELDSWKINNTGVDYIKHVNKLYLNFSTNASIIIRAACEISKEVYKARDDISRRVFAADELLKRMIKSIKRGDLSKFNKVSASNSFQYRYDNFFKPLIKQTKSELNLLVSQGKAPFDEEKFKSLFLKKMSDRFVYPNKDGVLCVWDREAYGNFIKHDIDYNSFFSSTAKCHLDPKKQETEDNIFIHFPKNNILWGAQPIENLSDWISKYEIDLDKWLKEHDDVDDRLYRTQMFNEAVKEVFEEINK
mgnify:CR=1 FL=1|tara:strand:+ start:1105 stop:2952 length:1848 start_codon:yes stop_codon:yes gene_type:complete